ncbi:MAG: hypothetical protein P4L76_08495 [Beijerinckiaceae bacterium]|nr:hypothetical protein [Beijerinckiaceae bacterium]
MPYVDAWPLIKAGNYRSQTVKPSKLNTRKAVLEKFDIEGEIFEHVGSLKLESGCYVYVAMAGHTARNVPLGKIASLIAALEALNPEDDIAKGLREEQHDIEQREKILRAAEIADAAQDDRSQAQKFYDAARDLGVDGDEEGFKSVLRKLAKRAKDA